MVEKGYFFLPWVWRARFPPLVSRVLAVSDLRLGCRCWALLGVACRPRRAQRGPSLVAQGSMAKRSTDRPATVLWCGGLR